MGDCLEKLLKRKEQMEGKNRLRFEENTSKVSEE